MTTKNVSFTNPPNCNMIVFGFNLDCDVNSASVVCKQQF